MHSIHHRPPDRDQPNPKLQRLSRRDLATLVAAVLAGNRENWKKAGVDLAAVQAELRRREGAA